MRSTAARRPCCRPQASPPVSHPPPARRRLRSGAPPPDALAAVPSPSSVPGEPTRCSTASICTVASWRSHH